VVRRALVDGVPELQLPGFVALLEEVDDGEEEGVSVRGVAW